MAVNCCFARLVMPGLAGVTTIEVRKAGPTVNAVEPTIEPWVADTDEAPLDLVATRPAGVTMATAVFDDDHVTDEVRSAVEPSE